MANKRKASIDMNKRLELPLAKYLVTLRDYVVKTCERLRKELAESPNPGAWVDLCKNLHVRTVLFNKRRGNEVSELKMDTFLNRPKWTETSMEFDEAITFVEQQFSKR